MKKIKVVAYLRYSDKKQDGNHSLEIQQSQIQLLADRENLEIIAWRIDKATSAFRGNIAKRKGMQQVLEDIANGEAEGICFYEESRITRSITDFHKHVYSPIKEQYPLTKFYSTQSEGEWNPNDPLTQAKLVFAAEESEIKSTRAKDTQSNLLTGDNPKRPGSPSSIGYDVIDGVLIPNGDAKIVELIFHLAGWGYAYDVIANYLNECGIKTAHRKKCQIVHWNSSTIGYILSNKAYAGDLAWNVRTSYDKSKPKSDDDILLLKQTHEPIVSATVMHLVKQAGILKQKYRLINTPYYLRNILFCKSCNSALIAKDNSPKGKNGQYMIYRCQNCKKSVLINAVHNSVLEDLKKKWSTQLSSFADTAQKQLKDWTKKINKAIKEQKVLLDRTVYNEKMLASELSNDKILAQTFINGKQHIQKEIQYLSTIQDEIQTILDDAYTNNFIKTLLQQDFGTFTDTELRMLFLMYFDQITINFDKNNDIEISYRLSPFVSLENATG